MRGFGTFTLLTAAAVEGYTVLDHKQFMVKNIDPIVVPGEYKSHMHSFFGSSAVTKDMPKTSDLQTGCYTGDNPNDQSVYWIPTLYYVKGEERIEVPPYRFSTYYNEIDKAEIGFPEDFFAIAGNAQATDQKGVDDGNNRMSWWCENEPGENKDGGKFPTKTCKTHLQTILAFQDCVNTNDLSKVAYSSASYGTSNRCPNDMKRIPQLRFSIRYDLRKIIPGGWSNGAPLQLACGTVGDGYCFHGDFINGWNDEAMNMMMTVAQDKRKWFFISGSEGSSPRTSNCAKDADPNGGTSNYDESVKMMNA